MSTLTPTLSLIKPDPSAVGDYANIDDLNTNTDRIDAGVAADRVRLTNLESAFNPVTTAAPTIIRKTATENRQSNITPSQDLVLNVNVTAGIEYEIEYELVVSTTGSTGGGLIIALQFPAMTYIDHFYEVPPQGPICSGSPTGTPVSGSPIITIVPANFPNGPIAVRFKVFCKPSASGQILLLWSQQSSNSNTTFMQASSFLVARRIA